jgi:hypothetical protein
MSETEKTKVRSLEIAFDDASWRRIEELKRKAGLDGDKNGDLLLMRNALMLYEWYMDQTAVGGEIGVVHKGRLTKHTLKF